MGMRMPETCWAVFKRQVINLGSCCIWLIQMKVWWCTDLQTQNTQTAIWSLTRYVSQYVRTELPNTLTSLYGGMNSFSLWSEIYDCSKYWCAGFQSKIWKLCIAFRFQVKGSKQNTSHNKMAGYSMTISVCARDCDILNDCWMAVGTVLTSSCMLALSVQICTGISHCYTFKNKLHAKFSKEICFSYIIFITCL